MTTITTPSIHGITPWPASLAKHYVDTGIWDNLSLYSHLTEAAATEPERVAISDAGTGKSISYGELLNRSETAAQRFVDLGLVKDDRVVIALPNGWQFLVVVLAFLRVGIIPVLALPAHRHHELRAISDKAQAKAFVSADVVRDFNYQELADHLRGEVPSLELVLVSGTAEEGNIPLDELLAPGEDGDFYTGPLPHGNDPALFLLSGGTTGIPKLIVRTNNDYAYNVRKCSEVAGLTAKSVYLAAMPVSHNFPLACPGVFGALYLGAHVVTLPSPNPVKAFPVVRQYGVTDTAVVPAIAQRWIDYQEGSQSHDLESLAVVQVGGSRMPDALARKVEPVLGARLQQVFGMAEGLINMTRLDDDPELICTTQGRPVSPEDRIRIVNESFQDVEAGERGEIIVQGPYTPRGYYNDPEANERSFHDGWYCPGDVVEKRTDGYLVVHGRNKDIINRGGEKISAEEIESLVYEIPGIQLAAIIGMPDEVFGERICLYVTPTEGMEVTLEDVRKHLERLKVATYKLPERLEVRASLPMTKVKKIDKKSLRDDISRILERN